MAEPLLEATDIAHAFDTPLFADVELSLNSGESAAIVGRSGSGKSTLLHICSTFLKPNAGEVRLLGKNLYAQKEADIEQIRRFDVGIIFQFHYLFKGMRAIENLEVAALLAQQQIDKKLLQKLEIADVIDHKIGDLSGGQQQRVSIARVLSKKPRIIFADEPTGNLDSETASLVMDVLEAYIAQEDAALLLVTHDNAMAQRCQKRYCLEEKKLKVCR